jgi:hypothetical protein
MTPQEASSRYHWCQYNKDTNTIELFLDNYMLSCLRSCEAKFYLEHLLNIKPRYTELDPANLNGKVSRKPWFFDFGEFVHYCLENFYNEFKVSKSPPQIDWWLALCKIKWSNMRMDDYKNSIVEADVKKYDEVKGWEGVAGLLCQYYAFYMDMRLRIIDTEITFGHNREVPIGKTSILDYFGYENDLIIECYLTGRIDLLVDNGYKIGPVDHKSTHKFDGFEHKDFNPHDAMTGYILAIHEILKNYYPLVPENSDHGTRSNLIPQCLGGWIYHISACTPAEPNKKSVAAGKKQGPRFKTTPVDKTISQLEDYKSRQLSTFKRVAELLFNNKVPEWNTTNCHNMFFRDCEYVPIHEQPSEQWQDIINRFYTIQPAWDTRAGSNKNKEIKSEETSNI